MALTDAALTPPGALRRNRSTGRDEAATARLELMVKGAKCAACIKRIEGALLALPGVEDARLNLSTQRLTLLFRTNALDPEVAAETVRKLGYEAKAFDAGDVAKSNDEEGRRLLRCMGVAGFASMNVMLLSVSVWAGFGEMETATRSWLYGVAGLIAIPAAIYAARPFFSSAMASLRKGRANMDVPISIAVILTLIVSVMETILGGEHAYFDGVVMLLFLLLIGRYLDHALRQRARTAASEMLAMQAVSAQRVGPDGALRSIPAREVAVGDLLFLAAGERAAVDGVIEDGVSELDRSLVTGESAPAPARVGDAIHAGSVNLTRPIRMRATATVDASTVAELARLIEAGEQGRAGHVRLADRAARLYVPVVHTAAALTFIGWFFLGGADWRIALMNAAAVLIITCPCALGLAVPAVQVVATGRLFKRGVFVKSGDALERLSQIDHVVMDKTGTLTMGRPRLVSAPDEALLSKAAMLARASRHPLSRALVDAAGCGAVAEGAIERQGQGVEGTVDGRMAKLGSAAFVGAAAINALNPAESELWFAFVGEPPVRFGFRDVLRPDAVEAVKALRARGFAVEISSGDRADAVREAARALEIEVAAGQRTPQQKIARLEALRAEGKRPLMVGDGLNDAAALAAASASASPGAAVDAAQAASDIVFQSERLSPLVEAIDVARAARKRVWENLWFSALYNVIAAPAAMAGLVTPLIAALAMAGSSLVVTLNALRLRGQAE